MSDRSEDSDNVEGTRQANRSVLESARRNWPKAFLDLAGSAPEFPYPDATTTVEPGPEFD